MKDSTLIWPSLCLTIYVFSTAAMLAGCMGGGADDDDQTTDTVDAGDSDSDSDSDADSDSDSDTDTYNSGVQTGVDFRVDTDQAIHLMPGFKITQGTGTDPEEVEFSAKPE